MKLLAGKDEYVNIYSSTSPSYLQWYPGRCDGQLGSLIRSGGAGEPNRDPSSPCVKAVLTSGDFQLADSKGDKIGRKKKCGEILLCFPNNCFLLCRFSCKSVRS